MILVTDYSALHMVLTHPADLGCMAVDELTRGYGQSLASQPTTSAPALVASPLHSRLFWVFGLFFFFFHIPISFF